MSSGKERCREQVRSKKKIKVKRKKGGEKKQEVAKGDFMERDQDGRKKLKEVGGQCAPQMKRTGERRRRKAQKYKKVKKQKKQEEGATIQYK